MNLPDYRIARAKSFTEFQEEVQTALDDGWQLYGSPFAANDTDGDSFLCQSLTRLDLICDNCGGKVSPATHPILCNQCSPTAENQLAVVGDVLSLLNEKHGSLRSAPKEEIEGLVCRLETLFQVERIKGGKAL